MPRVLTGGTAVKQRASDGSSKVHSLKMGSKNGNFLISVRAAPVSGPPLQ